MTWVSLSLPAWMVALVASAWLVPRRWQTSAPALVGVLFLGATAPLSLAVLSALGFLGYLLARNSRGRAWRALILILVAIASVVYFKWGFRLASRSANVIVPLGLAFYSLRIIHYAIDAYRGGLPAHGPLDYARYLLFFPTIIAGPINRFPEFHRDSRRRRWDSGLFATGLERILYGYFKIIVIGNYLLSGKVGVWLDPLDPGADWLVAYLKCLHYGLNLYFQFSGYSDVAIGLALLVGFRVPENFNRPFLAVNIGDFWRRWHMTLSGWCRDYVFGPVSASTRNAYLGVVSSMLVLGLWHELSPRYCLWGLYHGLGIVALRAFQRVKPRLPQPKSPIARRLLKLLSWALTMNFVVLGFAITSAPDLQGIWRMLAAVFTLAEG